MERLDDVLGYSGLKIFQDSDFFSFSLDSIILSNFCEVRKRDKNIVDLCSGNGIIPLILSRRTDKKIIGVEIQEKLVELANKSIDYNNLNDKIQIICDDVKNFSKRNLNVFDLVICNPPYFKVEEKSSFNLSIEKKIARHEIYINFNELCICAKQLLKDNGNFCFVHRSNRLMEILSLLRENNLEPKKVKFIHENLNKESTLVFIVAQKNGKVGLKIEKPLILYDLDGACTDEYKKMQNEVLL